MTNLCPFPPFVKGARFDKGRHGLGISIIKEVAEKYCGTLDLSVSEYEFILLVNIILPPPGSSS